MKIVCISDTHESERELEVPDGDVLIHSGDATYSGTKQSIIKFNNWLGSLPHKHKIFVAGNHDFLFEKDPVLARSLMTNATYLQDESINIDGVNFYGSPWQPWFHDWAFNLRRGAPIKQKWDSIPDTTNVLITHGPPYGIGDYCKNGHVGCKDLLDAIRRVRPKLHVFGHIHEGHGQSDSFGTKFVNASIMDDRYRPVYEPIVVKIK